MSRPRPEPTCPGCPHCDALAAAIDADREARRELQRAAERVEALGEIVDYVHRLGVERRTTTREEPA